MNSASSPMPDQAAHSEASQTAPQVPTLYVVATPIGNLGDLTVRARAVLAQVDRIAAEDTRNTGRLLDALGIRKPLMAHHDHNEADSAQGILACLARGESVALVSDAGTPAVSDPGAVLVKAVAAAGYPVVPVPGASSVLALVAASGLVQGPFTFRGFLPSKGAARLECLRSWLAMPEPQVLFEAPHRIMDLLAELEQVADGERQFCFGRELTKQFETFYRGSLSEVAQEIREDVYATKGEWALVWEGMQTQDEVPQERTVATIDVTEAAMVLLAELSARTVTDVLVKLTDLPKKQVYSLVLEAKAQLETGN